MYDGPGNSLAKDLLVLTAWLLPASPPPPSQPANNESGPPKNSNQN